MHGQEMCGAANAVKEAGEGIIWLDCSFKVTEGPPSVLVAMAGYLYFLQPYSSGKPFPHTGSLLTGLLRTLRVCPINVREKGSEEFCSGFRSWVESELRPEKHQHPPLDGVSLRRGMQCFLVPPPPQPRHGLTAQISLLYELSSFYRLTSHYPLHLFPGTTYTHIHSSLCASGENTFSTDKSSTELKDEWYVAGCYDASVWS